MKKKILIILLVCILLIINACGIQSSVDKDEQKAYMQFESTLTAIQKKDKKALRKEFTQKAIQGSNNFGSDEEKLFDFIQGKLESWKNVSSSGGKSTDEGKSRVEEYMLYTLQTSKETYEITIVSYVKNELDHNDTGIHQLFIVKAKDQDALFSYEQSIQDPGLYILENN